MTQAFYRKWRPQKWDEVIAQEHVIQTLRNAVRTGHTGHAYLLSGPRGTGKTTTARLLAKALNCLADDLSARPCDACLHCKAINEGRFLDLIEIDAASNTSVDDVRELREKINFSPTQGRYKVYIIDEVHMLSTAAFNALLKTLEEPPPHAVFVLATTEVHKIPATILSRVQRYEFRRIPVQEIVKHLRNMAKEEKIAVDEDALLLIARQATGAMRDAISLLDQLASTGEKVTLKEAQTVLGTATNTTVIELVKCLREKDPSGGMKVVHVALDGGTDARQFARQATEYLRGLMLVKMGNADQVDATVEMRRDMAGDAQKFSLPELVEAIRVFNGAASDARSAWSPGLALELAVAEIAGRTEPVQTPAAAAQPVAATQHVTSPAPTRAASAERHAPVAPEEDSSPHEHESAHPAHQPASAPTQKTPQATAPASPARAGESTAQPTSARTAQKVEQQPTRPAETPPAQPAADVQPGKTVTQNDLQQNWVRIRAMVKKRNPLSEALLNSCRYLLKDGNLLVLSFQAEVVKSKMESEDNIKILREALFSILGVKLNVRCVLATAKAGSAGSSEIDGDGIVGTALDLGGKIVYEE
jgi:DNA polymerase III subunit gamma/tau